MAEVKRIQLDSVRAPQREKRTKEVTPTFRFNLPLNESTDSACPEYSYGELVKAARAENGENKTQGADPFGDDDDDDEKLQEIARKFEEKYNPKPGKKRKKKPGDWEDYIDKGMGYDETDPFIDNEEAYDELVPSTLTTQFGGFYINTGELEFRNVSETENGLDEKIRKKRRKREILEKEGRKRRKISKDDQMPKRRGRKTANQTESALPKVKKKTQPTVADMLQQHKAQLQLQQQEKLQLSPIPVERHIEPEIVPDAPPPVAPQLPSYPATVAPSSTISDAIESVVKAAGDEASSNGSVGQPTGSSDGEETPAKPPIDNIEAPKLPDNLPPDLDTLVAKLKKAAHNSEEGKCKFFSEDVNKMLLSVELKSQQLTSTQRSTIYSHLASHLPCTKETLQKRAKKLRLDQEDGKLREPMQNLKNAIAEVMPEMLEKYAAALKAAEASREDEKSEAQNSQGTDDDTQGKEDKKAPQAPRKKFEWNESIRKYLCDVVSIKMKCYEVSKTRVQSAEEYLKHFLDTEVRTLWPDGWMKARILFKESQAAHSYITSKQKKPLVVKKSVNNVPPLVVSMKPAVSILNSTVLPAEPDAIEPLSLSDKLVPTQLVTPLTEEVAEKKENSDVSSGVIALNSADKPSDLTKLITFPIKTTADLLLSPKHTEDGSAIQITNSKLLTDVPAKSVASTVNSKPEPVASANAAVQKVIDKIIVTSQVSPTKQSSVTSTKISDMTSAFSESSLASDMLARIICASLGNFPYAGSSAVDGSAEVKPQSVITSSSIIQNLKESRVVSSKLPTSDSVTSPKKFENVKPVNLELKKPSQDVVLQCNSQSIGSISIDALLNAKLTSRSSDIGTTSVLIKKNLPEPTKPAVNLKLKDVIVPQPQQFAEAFERYGTESSPLIRKHSSKISNHHLQNFTLPNASPIRFSNASELPNDKTVSSSTRITLENAQRLSQDLVAKYANPTTSQSLLTAPLKKRSKYSQSTKTSSEQWGPYVDVPHGATSLLEGMKGFPFPVNTLPTPPPAHCSAPHKTTASQPQDTTFTRLHAPSNSQRTSAHSASVLRVHQDSRGESTQAHPHVLVAEAPRRQSLIQGTWKANPTSQASSTSHSQYLSAGSPLISNPKSTSPNQHSSNTHKIPSPIHAHSHSAPLIEKVSPAHSQNPLPLRVSSSHTPQSVAHPAKTSSPSSIFSQTLSQVQFPAHQSSHPSSTHQEQTPARNNSSFGAAHSPVTTVTSPAGSFPHSQGTE